jgi:methyltransferase (TIGR00027 family)
MKSEVTRSAWGAAFIKSIEKFQPEDQKLFTDRLISRLMPLSYRLVLLSMKFKSIRNLMLIMIEKQGKGVMGALLCRTCYMDKILQKSLEDGIRQVVILGAGMDSRPYRNMVKEEIVFFEVDYPEVLGKIPSSVFFVPIDFNTQSLEEAMAQVDFSLKEKTLFIWEGVTQYISHEAAEEVLRFISGSQKGSLLVFTYIIKSFIDQMDAGADQEPFDKKFIEKLKQMWVNGYDPDELPGYLSTMNLRIVEDLGKEEFKSRYLDPRHRAMSLLNVERIALVRKN